MANGLHFNEALQDAKEKGYAETNPILDIDGDDAAAKLVIMANWIMGYKVTLKDVDKTGITNIAQEEIVKATREGKSLKLIATCDKEQLFVRPIPISKDDPICVNGTLNAVTFQSEHSGAQTIIGKGAGGMETASSVLRDLIEIKENFTNYQLN
jgi:homoserine dehydrogenase